MISNRYKYARYRQVTPVTFIYWPRSYTASSLTNSVTKSGPQPNQPDEPINQMLRQILGEPSGNDDMTDSLSAGLMGLMGGMGQSPLGGMQFAPAAAPQSFMGANIWRVVHAITSLLLGLYVSAMASAFDGTKSSRLDRSETLDDNRRPAFWTLFATAEVLLQTSRFFLERGNIPPAGVVGMLASVLPPPWANYARLVGRYSIILSTVVADAMVIVFVLGCVSWWRA